MRGFKKYILINLIIFMVIVFSINSVNAQIFGTGLEVEKPEIAVNVQIESGKSMSEDLIRSKIELKLRQNNIKVLNNVYKNDYHLNTYVKTLNNQNITSYYIEIAMMRVVSYYNDGKKYKKLSPLWQSSGIGYGAKDNIIKGVEDYTDIFINEFYKVNDF